MKKVFYLIIVSIMTFFKPKSPYAQNVFYGTVMERGIVTFQNSRSVLFILGFFALLSTLISSFLGRKKANITFMEDGREVKKLCNIISSDKKKTLFKIGKKTYTLKTSEIIKIKKSNTSLMWSFALFIFLVLLCIAGQVIDYVTRPVQSHIDHVDLGVYLETLE